MKTLSPFRYFNSSPEVIRYAVWLYISSAFLSSVEDILFERGTDVRHEAVPYGHVLG